MTIRNKRYQAFTLIELLVVITIIAILATVATPMMNKARIKARMIPATKDAGSILQALTLYIGDSGGLFPEGSDNSNAAYRQLFPDACDNETMFYVQGDTAFCSAKPPDGDYGESDGEFNGKALQAGENHWAYVTGLTDSDKSSTPIIADGFTKGTIEYDNRRHVWSALNLAIVGYIDGSVRSMKIRNGVVPKDPENNTGNLFDLEIMQDDPNVQVLNPLPRPRGTGDQA